MRNKRPKKEVNTNEWLNTYSDTVTLILCFFVMLFSFSTVNEKKWERLVKAFNLDKYHSTVSDITSSPDDSEIDLSSFPEDSDLDLSQPTPKDALYDTIQDYIDNHNLSSKVELLQGDRTITLRFRDTILFDPDSAVLRSDGKEILSIICDLLNQSVDLIDKIEFEGHTAANKQGEPKFINTFEFSAERAVNVLEYSRALINIDPKKLCAVGYGQYNPIGDNETEEGRASNRRVEIVIKSSEAAAATSDPVTISTEDNTKGSSNP